mgnify:CR=1 FL=1
MTLWMSLAMATEVVTVSWGFTNVHALVDGDHVVLVDAHYPRNTDKLLRRLGKAGVDVDHIEALVVTHAHADHAGSAMELAERLGVPILAGAADVDDLAAGRFARGRVTGLTGAFIYPVAARGYPEVAVDVVVDDALDLSSWGIEGEARWVGGHTAGSLVVTLPDAVLVGDLVRGGMLAPRRPRTHFLHADADAVEQALPSVLDGVSTVYTGHGGPLEAERVRQWLAR